VAEELADDGIEDPTTAQRRERRLKFAKQYLDKLVNVEIPLPQPNDEQALQLLLPAKSREVSATTQRRWRSLEPLMPAALAAASIVAGVWVGTYIASPAKPPDTAKGVQTRQAASQQPGTAAPVPSAAIDLRNVPKSPEPKLHAPPAPMLFGLWLLGIGTVMVAAFALWKLKQPPELVVHDSEEFEKALTAWSEVIQARQNTPRSLKRFLNRVRYLAMYGHPSVTDSGSGLPEWALVALAARRYSHLAPDSAKMTEAIHRHRTAGLPWPPSEEQVEMFGAIWPRIRGGSSMAAAGGQALR
jgi:hypothetical protein